MRLFFCAFFFLISGMLFSQKDEVVLRPNRGQWFSKIDYAIDLHQGKMYLEESGFTFFLTTIHKHTTEHNHAQDEAQAVCVKSVFHQAQQAKNKVESKQLTSYRNYFIGNDERNWRSHIQDIQEVTYLEKYPHIDLQVSTENSQAKYAWIVKPGGDYTSISWHYEGSNSAKIKSDGTLQITHLLGTITEGKPIAWTLHQGKRIPIPVKYIQNGNQFSFEISGQYDQTDTLIIDPSLTFSTFTGSTADNWGFTAAPDVDGNLIAGGIVFGTGYPTTTGVVSEVFVGGAATPGAPIGSPLRKGFDIGLSKFNPDGTAFIFSTYLGGGSNETPHSIVTDASGNIYVFGATSSTDYPTTVGAFDNSFNGGPTINPDNLNFDGSDIYVSKINSSGTSLLASTYVGGTGIDGINLGTLQYNYGDNFRGEIVVDANYVYFSSVSQSVDFPIVGGFQTSLNGTQDAVIVKMPTNLASISWSTYYGGSMDETGNGIQLAPGGSLYVVGGTNSSGLSFGAGGVSTTYANNRDGFLIRLNAATGSLVNGTYIGTVEYDQAYFVEVDDNNSVYVLGQTDGSMTISPGCYGNPNSGLFIRKYNTNLSSLLWSTNVGAGSGNIELSPTAFLVSNCKDIYLSGWGGTVNAANSQAVTSSSNNMPVTSDAFQSNTNGSNFWLAVFSENAATLKYATYFGGTTSSSNHVDGGTSRFDKNGNIYHAVCGACGSNNFGFTTTPGVVGPQNLSSNCNLAAFKFSLNQLQAIISTPSTLVCIPDPVVFTNNSAAGTMFEWNFGDGATSTAVNPTHYYAGPGQYQVTLIVKDSANCYIPDTTVFIVNIGDFNGGVVQPLIVTCPNNPTQLEAFGGAVYQWQPAAFLDNPSISNPIATVNANTTFTCIISDSCGIDTVTVEVQVQNMALQISNDTSICRGNSVPLFVSNVQQVTWSPANFLDDPTSTTPTATPFNTITYFAQGTLLNGCTFEDSVFIQVDTIIPQPNIPDSLIYCLNEQGTVTVSGATTYSWSPAVDIFPTNAPTVSISSPISTRYYCDFMNACGTVRDSLEVEVLIPVIIAWNDTIVCPKESAILHASGGISYEWSPAESGRLVSDGSEITVNPAFTSIYVVTGIDSFGCSATDSVLVSVFPEPVVHIEPIVYAQIDEVVTLNAVSETAITYVWTPAEFLSCNVCQTTQATPNQPFTYTVIGYDVNGCRDSNRVTIKYDPLIYVPNTFTPNNNGTNDQFFALGINVVDFRLEIYNRWGELIYKGDALSAMWDGTYHGKNCPDGVYTWKIEYGDLFTADRHRIVGHVSLLR